MPTRTHKYGQKQVPEIGHSERERKTERERESAGIAMPYRAEPRGNKEAAEARIELKIA